MVRQQSSVTGCGCVQLCGGDGKHRDVAERHSWNWEFVRDWLATRLVADVARARCRFIERNLYYRWKDEVEAGAKAALGGRSAAARPDAEQEKRIKQLERALGRSHLQIEILKNVLGE